MPGIVGCITRRPCHEAAADVRKMTAAMLHEDFYVADTWAEESHGVYLGWVARIGSFSAQMPVQTEQQEVTLVLSGEEFPEPDTVHRLKAQGHNLDDDGPSYLPHLYEEDPSFPAGLNGRFHGILVDRCGGKVILFNDRYGMHRVYYHQAGDTFYFAAEAKAILAVCPELRRLDPRGLGEFVSCGAVLEDRTLFEGIQILPPASAWIFRNGLIKQRGRYFHPREWEEQERLDPKAYYQELHSVFSRNLPRYFAGRERIGMSLTGGLDTRMILAHQKSEPGSLPCYTFGSMFRDNQDVRIARRVADICQQPHQVITAGEEFLSRFSHYAERAIYLTDGCVDVSRCPDLYLNERVHEIAPVRMTGNYGGEILREVRAFKPVEPIEGLFSSEFVSHIHQAKDTYKEIGCGHPVSFAAFYQGPWYLYNVLALEQTQLSMRSPYLDNDFVRTVFRSPMSALSSNEVSQRLIADGDRRLLGIPTDRGIGGKQGNIFGSVSRGILEFLFKAEYAFDMGMPQWLARVNHTLSFLQLERAFLGRHKPFHFRVWYRDILAEYLQEVLLDPRSLSRPYINRPGLRAMVHGHVKGNRNYTNELHKVLTLELFHRLFIDDSEAAKYRKPLSFSALATAAVS